MYGPETVTSIQFLAGVRLDVKVRGRCDVQRFRNGNCTVDLIFSRVRGHHELVLEAAMLLVFFGGSVWVSILAICYYDVQRFRNWAVPRSTRVITSKYDATIPDLRPRTHSFAHCCELLHLEIWTTS